MSLVSRQHRSVGGRCSCALLLAAALVVAGIPVSAQPARVVSINLCTDQLALMLAAPGQLISVTAFAQDPEQSPMAEAARALPANHARAEEIYLLRPDLVLASDFTAPTTLAMLRRLGLRVETFPAAMSLADTRAAIGQMGIALGREPEAAQMQARFDEGRAALRADRPANPPRTALYETNGYTPGPQSLAGEIADAAGLTDIAAEAGLPHGGYLPLETLIMLAPEAIIAPQPPPIAGRGDERAAHPTVQALRDQGIPLPSPDADWTCATPRVLDAARRLAEARKAAGR